MTGHALTLEEIFNLATTTSSSTADTLTFAELKDLIDQGKTNQIPNNRHIPDAINVRIFSHLVCDIRIYVYLRMLLPANQQHRRGRSHGRFQSNEVTLRDLVVGIVYF
jgi:hypothetical protein